MPKALWIIQVPVFGGLHNIALRLHEPLRQKGVETAVLLPDEPGTAADRLRAGNVPVVTVPLQRVRRSRDPRTHLSMLAAMPADVGRIRHKLRQGSYDLVVLAGLAIPHGAIAARLEGVPIVWQIVDTVTPPPVRAAFMPLVRRWADAVMFNGEALAKLHCGDRPLAQPSVLFTGPVDTDRLRPATAADRAAMRAELGVPPGAPFVGTVANINPTKGVEWFVRAAEGIYRARRDAWFLISGASYDTHARYRAQVERELRASSVPPERWVLRDDPPERQYPALDVKLITSVPASEGRTTTGPEAMACGIPVVATDVGAVSEVIEHGGTGLIVPPLDADALTTATLRLLSDPALRARLGRAGRERAVERYSLEPSASVYADCFAAALGYHASR